MTARGAAALVVGILLAIAANITSAPVLLYPAVLLVLLPIISIIVVHAERRRGRVARQVSTDLLTVGDESSIAVRFDLRSPGIPRGLWRDELPDAIEGRASGTYPPEREPIVYPVTGLRRGIWTIGPLILRTVDPFGLAQREQSFGDSRTVTVVPQVVPLTPLSSRWGAAGGATNTASNRLGQGSDNLSPRPYVAGDSMRRVHWRATAHRGELMVRQEEEESSPDAVVVLDRAADRWSDAPAGEDAGFEAAVTACASVAVLLADEGYSVDVHDSAGVLLGELRGHEDDRDALLVALATLRPRGTALPSAIAGSAPPGPLVVITGRASADRIPAHGGAALPLLLAADSDEAALAAASEHGWHAALLTDDVAACWADALPDRAGLGAGDARR